MDEPTRAQQEQVARELLGRRSEPHGQDIHGKPTFQQWHASGCTAESCGVRYGPCSHALPAWNSPDFLWPLICALADALDLSHGNLLLSIGRVPEGTAKAIIVGECEPLFGNSYAEAVWAAALAVTGEGG